LTAFDMKSPDLNGCKCWTDGRDSISVVSPTVRPKLEYGLLRGD